MELKIKVTYIDTYGSGQMMAKIFIIYGWYNFANDLSMQGIPENALLKVEVIADANDLNTQDLTESM